VVQLLKHVVDFGTQECDSLGTLAFAPHDQGPKATASLRKLDHKRWCRLLDDTQMYSARI